MDRTTSLDHEADARSIEEICNLPSQERETRMAAFRREILPLVKSRQKLANGMSLNFEYSDALDQKLQEFVAFERVCCSDLEWGLSQSRLNGLSLSVSGLSPQSPLLEGIEDEDIRPRWSAGLLTRLTQSLGLGATAALLFCCVAPIGLAAVAGVAIAAPFARLDNPIMIAAGSLAFAIPAWFWLKRRSARSSCGC